MSKRHTHRVGDLNSLFSRLEELISASSGADVFEETLKLVAAKLLDELQHGDVFMRPGVTSLNAAIERAAQAWRGVLKAPFALEMESAAAQHCAALLAGYRLQESPESLDALFEMLVTHTAKGSKGQYFTPRFVVDFCVRLVDPTAADSVLDPACGSGAFLSAAMQHGAGSANGYDIDERAVRIAKLLFVSRGRDPSCIRTADALREESAEPADIVLTNPPFAGNLVDADLLNRFELARERTRIERDVLFLEHSVRAVRPRGHVAIILPHNKFAGTPSRYVREWLFKNTEVLAVIGLGRNTFLPHTHQKANVLLARRRSAPQNGKTERIFFAQSERDGKNRRGQSVPGHDLDEILDAYRAFRSGP